MMANKGSDYLLPKHCGVELFFVNKGYGLQSFSHGLYTHNFVNF